MEVTRSEGGKIAATASSLAACCKGEGLACRCRDSSSRGDARNCPKCGWPLASVEVKQIDVVIR